MIFHAPSESYHAGDRGDARAIVDLMGILFRALPPGTRPMEANLAQYRRRATAADAARSHQPVLFGRDGRRLPRPDLAATGSQGRPRGRRAADDDEAGAAHASAAAPPPFV